jgi:hypothetical protein
MARALTEAKPANRPSGRDSSARRDDEKSRAASTPRNEISFGVTACAAWAPGRESWADWCAWAGTIAPVTSDESVAAPTLLRRRVGQVGQKALKAAWGLPRVRDARYVFASRHGEFERTTSLLRAVINGEPLSPADFSLSVHNALTGLLSIAAGNRAGHTTIAAGVDSFCYGLLEAAACIAEAPAQPVIVVSYDAPLIAPFDELIEPSEPLAVVLSLAAAGSGAWCVGLSSEANAHQAEPDPRPAESFLRFLLAGNGSAHAAGTRLTWTWRHV